MVKFFAASVLEFLHEDPQRIVGVLTSAAESQGFSHQLHTQTRTWHIEIEMLRTVLGKLTQKDKMGLVIEYPIPRRGKRIDAVLTTPSGLIILEFKVGANSVSTSEREQVEDYCLDLRDFHSASKGHMIWPILIATECKKTIAPENNDSLVKPTAIANETSLCTDIMTILEGGNGKPALPMGQWVQGVYRPTPTIIEAACELYSRMDVTNIAHSHAGQTNLIETSQAVLDVIKKARAEGRKLICFITGVPGAGKTLAGLNIVHSPKLHKGKNLGVFLSGNGPLVKVLREALAQDNSNRTGMKLSEARRQVSTFVQNVHWFMDEYAEIENPPPDRVVIFDEAQRAWNAKHSWRKFRRRASEPTMMLEVMSRHDGWATLVALIGGGQEINTGEAGLAEWGRALQNEFPDWLVFISDRLVRGDHSTGGQALFQEWPQGIEVITNPALHLSVSLRAFRAERISDWVATVLSGDAERARRIANNYLEQYPLLVTRELENARHWLRSVRRGSRRSGLLATSGARRLRPYGIDVRSDLEVEKWFLAPSNDVRSSSFLELVATETNDS